MRNMYVLNVVVVVGITTIKRMWQRVDIARIAVQRWKVRGK